MGQLRHHVRLGDVAGVATTLATVGIVAVVCHQRRTGPAHVRRIASTPAPDWSQYWARARSTADGDASEPAAPVGDADLWVTSVPRARQGRIPRLNLGRYSRRD
ncbi:MAG: hypothetical protein ACR2GX_05010 [Candidatus Dormibacteria bacterium]